MGGAAFLPDPLADFRQVLARRMDADKFERFVKFDYASPSRYLPMTISMNQEEARVQETSLGLSPVKQTWACTESYCRNFASTVARTPARMGWPNLEWGKDAAMVGTTRCSKTLVPEITSTRPSPLTSAKASALP